MTKVAVIGYGIEGRASVKHWLGRECDVEVRDVNPAVQKELPAGVTCATGPGYLDNLGGFDVIVRSPGTHPDKIVEANKETPDITEKVTSSTNEFLEQLSTKNVIGVTGTKGKGTCTTITAKLLEAAGAPVHMGGNIGIPILDMLPDINEGDWVVIELSSFQLFDLKHRISNAICLTITPEHQNWHSDIDDYEQAKGNLFRLQDNGDVAIYNSRSDTATRIAALSSGAKVPFDVPPVDGTPLHREAAYVEGGNLYYKDTEICSIDEVVIPGRHNLENVSAAIIAVWDAIDGDIDAIRSILTTFTGLHDHLELVGEPGGVKYYNDTYATAPDAAIAAMHAFEQDKVMLLGGIDKKVPLPPFVDAIITGGVKGVVLIDDLAVQLEPLFTERGYESFAMADSMSDAVKKAHSMADSGDVVLLSPGCAGNGGWFLDKLERGRLFNEAVKSLDS